MVNPYETQVSSLFSLRDVNFDCKFARYSAKFIKNMPRGE